jgi:hypothetical protein
LASWLRRTVLPSIATIGRSTPVSAAASSRSERIQALKQASNTSGFTRMRTRRKTSLPGTPRGRSRISVRSSSLYFAQRAIAVGPAAPASTARTAITRTLGSGCRRLISDRGSSNVEKDSTISSNLLRVLAIADLRPPGLVQDTVDGIPTHPAGAQAARFAKSL